MNFHSCEKDIFKFFGCTKIRNEVMQPTSSNNDSRSIFPYIVQNRAGFDNHLLTEKALFT